MSKRCKPSPCPFCGHRTLLTFDSSAGRYAVRCRNEECNAIVSFYDIGRDHDGMLKRFNKRCSCGAFEYILMGAALTLIITVIFCLLVVTDRAENVSHETSAPQIEIEQQAAEQPATEYAARMYTDADAVALAQMAYGESRGVLPLALDGKSISPAYQQACSMWVALNRFDAGFEGESIAEIVAAPRQFHGYDPEHPISDELLALAYDVLERWQEEKNGAADVGRVLPAEYLFFTGNGDHNNFTVEYGTGIYYTWELPDPYVGEV